MNRPAQFLALVLLSTALGSLACVNSSRDTPDTAAGGAAGTGGTAGGIGATDIGEPPAFCTAGSDPVDPVDASASTAVDGGASVMRDISSMALVGEMGVGWNLGNTMDALGGETAWGNLPTTQDMIQAIADSGFKSVRIPVTWMQHFGASPCYPIDAAWMARVQQIVDWVIGAGMYAIINVHHDGGDTDPKKGDGWIRRASTDYAGVIAKYKALWTQIAQRFKDYPDYLVFESMNEVGFDDLNVNGSPSQTAFDLLNRINAEFVALVRKSGGNNSARHLLLAGYWTDIDRSSRGWVRPNDSRTILSVHYYTPYQFCIDATQATWGTATDISILRSQLGKLKTAFLDKGIPVILGEFGVSTRTEAASRVYWVEYVAKTCRDLGVAPYFWDDGSEFNRTTLTWRTPGIIDAFKRAASGQAYTITKGP